jgi:hypothetical protein
MMATYKIADCTRYILYPIQLDPCICCAQCLIPPPPHAILRALLMSLRAASWGVLCPMTRTRNPKLTANRVRTAFQHGMTDTRVQFGPCLHPLCALGLAIPGLVN